jgi:hypothetical protein
VQTTCTLPAGHSERTTCSQIHLTPSGRFLYVGNRAANGSGIADLMATSSVDDLPRQIEFLYSRNRLNVAVSRARCLAVIVASPRFLETSCTTIEQIRLVNALCWAKNFADGLCEAPGSSGSPIQSA